MDELMCLLLAREARTSAWRNSCKETLIFIQPLNADVPRAGRRISNINLVVFNANAHSALFSALRYTVSTHENRMTTLCFIRSSMRLRKTVP